MKNIFLSLLASLLLTPLVLAQSGLDKAVVVAGLTTTSGTNTFAWIALQPTDPGLLLGKQIAVYRKTGAVTSAAPYARVAVIQPEADVRLVESLINRAAGLGENITELNTLLSEMLEKADAAGSVTTAQKLSALIISSWGHDDKMRRLMMLAKQRPSVAMCAGLAHAERIASSGVVTFELRDFDAAAGKDIGIIGRVTVDPASPMLLPAPGAPVELPDKSAKGNLNATLRWGTPNALRDLSPLHYGYDLYRVTESRALAKGWNATPPATTAALVADIGTSKVNSLAILPDKTLTNAEASNLADDTVFVMDDNGRFKTGGTVFADASAFYYFVVARDLLGHGGTPSAGTLVTIWDRLPPNAPRKLQVRNQTDFVAGVRNQRLRIEWEEPHLNPGESISAYYVYRWLTPSEIPAKSKHLDEVEGRPDRNLVAILPGTQRWFEDDGSVATPAWAEIDRIDGVRLRPTAPLDHGKTFFYTVRAVDNSSCANYSGNSAPVWGVLRDRKGPQGSNGSVLLNCFDPTVVWNNITPIVATNVSADAAHLKLVCSTSFQDPLYAEFKAQKGTGPASLLGRACFQIASGGREAVLNTDLPLSVYDPGSLWCRVGTAAGWVSPWVKSNGDQGTNSSPAANKILQFKWVATMSRNLLPGADCGWRNQGIDHSTDATTDISGTFVPTADSAEWRIYRRVDGGNETLIAQGEIHPVGSAVPIIWTDDAPPSGNCTICYYLQLLDSNSNPSTMEQQGECIVQSDAAWLPTPMLEPLESVPPSITPRMKVSWFCNPAGVERFEIWVGRRSGSAPTSSGSGLSVDQEATHPNYVSTEADAMGVDFSVFQTALARHLNPSGSPEFTVNLPVSASDEYIVMVRAVGVGNYTSRFAGSFSNVESASFTTRNFTFNPQVPWPERALPSQASFHNGITATHLNVARLSPWKGNAVRIGEYADPLTTAVLTVGTKNGQTSGGSSNILFYRVSTLNDPRDRLYINDEVKTAEPRESPAGCVLPIAMYRVQVANTNFSVVPGDIVQVTPMMERIAYVKNIMNGNVEVTDPWITILHESDSPLTGTNPNYDHDIYLVDRQPVLKGARYKYLLVRFSPNKEIERVIVTNTVDVP
jgi:hypothetical protein